MMKSFFKKIISIALVLLTLFFIFKIPAATVRADELVGYINSDYVNFRSGPGTSFDTIEGIQFRKNTDVTIIGQTADQSGDIWYEIRYESYTGYVYGQFVSFKGSADNSDTDFENLIASFPESYKNGLRQLHSIYPNYVFEPDRIPGSFSEWVDIERPAKVLHYDYTYKSMLAMTDDNFNWNTGQWQRPGSGWSTISFETCAYYMDPRNFFNSSDIYMFLRQDYSQDQTADKVRNIIKGTFMEKNYTPKKGDKDDEKYKGDYAEVIVAAAKASGVSAYFIATNIIGEQGIYGSPLCSGNYPGYEGYYNFYNYDAWGANDTEVIVRGLQYAKVNGWDSIYKSILEGAKIYAEGYIDNSQDTFFYKDYNLLGAGGISHQYAGAASAPLIHSNTLSQYLSTDKDLALHFRIPVYDKMPDDVQTAPVESDLCNNYYFTNITGNLSPSFNIFTTAYEMTVSGNTEIDVYIHEGAEYAGKESISLVAGNNTVALIVKSQTGYYRTYKLSVISSGSFSLKINVKPAEFSKDNPPEDNTDSTEKPTDNTQPTEDPTDPTKPTEEPTEKPTESTEPTEDPTEPSEKPSDGLFSDMKDPSVSYYKPVYWASSKDYIRGFSDGTFRPSDFCTRGQFAIILWRLAGRPAPESANNPFTDVSSSDSYYKAILWAVENDIIRGYNDGTFRPENTVSRLNVVIMLWRLAGRPEADGGESAFPDVSSSMSGFKAVNWGESTGVIRGANGYFLPDDNCTRAQIVIFFYRFARDIRGEDVSIN